MSGRRAFWAVACVLVVLPGITDGASVTGCRAPQASLPAGGWEEAEARVRECSRLGESALLSREEVERAGTFYDQWFHGTLFVRRHPEVCSRWMWGGAMGLRQACLEAWLRGDWKAESFDWKRWFWARSFVSVGIPKYGRTRAFETGVRVLLRLEEVEKIDVGEHWVGVGVSWLLLDGIRTRLADLPAGAREELASLMNEPRFQWEFVVETWWVWMGGRSRRVWECVRSVRAYVDLCRAGLASPTMQGDAAAIGLPGCDEMRKEPWTEERIERWCRRLPSGCGGGGSSVGDGAREGTGKEVGDPAR